MAEILAVHGIGQQFKGENVLISEWLPSLTDGLKLAGSKHSNGCDLDFAFYGDLFRNSDSLGEPDEFNCLKEEDIEMLLDVIWKAASEENKDVIAKEEFDDSSLGRTPKFIQRGLNSIAKSPFFARIAQELLLGDLKQVVSYLNNKEIHDQVLNRVLKKITPDTKVVIGHSLGSVVAYEALCQKSNNVVSYITIGSPLGIRNLIFDKLTPRPNGKGEWPGSIKFWTNIADKGDIVALEKEINDFFNGEVKDLIVYNGSHAHHGEFYLTTLEAGTAINEGLCTKST